MGVLGVCRGISFRHVVMEMVRKAAGRRNSVRMLLNKCLLSSRTCSSFLSQRNNIKKKINIYKVVS